jgi:hypothetical protein
MRWWKWVGLAGLVGAVAVGAVVLQRRRAARSWTEYPPDELRSRLRERLDTAVSRSGASSGAGADRTATSGGA